MIRLLGLDPGKHYDSFGLVLVEVEPQRKEIRVMGAKEWRGKAYLQIENEIAEIYQRHHVDHIVIERNHTGEHIYEVLQKQKHLPVFAITTSNNINPERIHSGKTMDKNATVQYLIQLIQEEKLIFPTIIKNPAVKELKRQMTVFAEHRTEAGHLAYYAQGNEHDDLVMALLLVCYIARERYFRERGVIMAQSKPKQKPFDNGPLIYDTQHSLWNQKDYAIYYPS